MQPRRQEGLPALLAGRLDLGAAALARVRVHARQEPPRTPLLTARGLEVARDRKAAPAQRLQGDRHLRRREGRARGELLDLHRTADLQMALHGGDGGVLGARL